MIDFAARIVLVAGEHVQLSAKDYELLVALAEDPERIFRKEDLLRDVWGFRSLGGTSTVPAVDDRNLRLLDEFAARAAEDVSKMCHPAAPE